MRGVELYTENSTNNESTGHEGTKKEKENENTCSQIYTKEEWKTRMRTG